MKYLSGRPAYYAELPFTKVDPTLELLYSFNDVASKLRYREVMGLARSFNCSYEAVLRWKYGLSKPGFETMMKVVEWGKQGKPLVLRKREALPTGKMV